MHGGPALFLRLICLDQTASHSLYLATVGVFGCVSISRCGGYRALGGSCYCLFEVSGCVSQVTGGEDAFDVGSPDLVDDDFVHVVQIETQPVWQIHPRVRADLDEHAV